MTQPAFIEETFVIDGGPPLPAGLFPFALSHGGPTSLSVPAFGLPIVPLTDSGLTSNATVTFPAPTTVYLVDLTGVTFGGHTVILQAGTGAKTASVTAAGVYLVYVTGNNVYAVQLS